MTQAKRSQKRKRILMNNRKKKGNQCFDGKGMPNSTNTTHERLSGREEKSGPPRAKASPSAAHFGNKLKNLGELYEQSLLP